MRDYEGFRLREAPRNSCLGAHCEEEKLPVAGRVIRMTPKGAQGKRTAGIGVQFSEDRGNAQKKLENYLAGALVGDKPTHTR